jgi:hypothetical protein
MDKLMYYAGIGGMATSITIVTYMILPASSSPGKLIACVGIGAVFSALTMLKRGRA